VTANGATLMRPLVMDFPKDNEVLNIGGQYLFGPSIMVTPVTIAGAATQPVYVPASAAPWYDFWTGKTVPAGHRVEAAAPVETLPLFIRPGSILPMGPFLQYSSEKPADPIELRIYGGTDGKFTLYEDEGDNYSYEKQAYATIAISWSEGTHTLEFGKRTGEFPGMLKERTFNIIWVSENHGAGIPIAGKPDAVVRYRGDAVRFSRP